MIHIHLKKVMQNIFFSLTSTRFGKNISKDELTDWARLMGCKKIYCAFTNYPLSALIFSPDTEINMLSRDHSNGYVTIDEEVYSCVDVFFKEYLKNGRWI